MNKWFYFLAAIFTAALVSCSVASDPIVESSVRKISIHASHGDYPLGIETRTIRVDDASGSMLWCQGDAISLFYGHGTSGGSRFVSQNTQNVAVTNFVGSIEAITGGADVSPEDTYFWGLYPYDETAECDGSSIVMRVPEKQEAVEGTYANGLYASLGRSSGLAMAFYNICGGFRFSVNKEGVKRVTFKGNNGEMITGKARIVFDESGRPAVKEIIDGKDYIVLESPSGQTLTPGSYYYMAMFPTVFTQGLTITFETEDEEGIFVRTKAATVNRSKCGSLTKVDAEVTYSQISNDVLYYTSTDGNIVTPHNPDAFGATIVSNTYEDGRGRIMFDGDVTMIGENAFYSCTTLSSLTIPQSVTSVSSFVYCNNLERFSGKYASDDGRFLIDDGVLLAVAGKDLADLCLPESVEIVGSGSLAYLGDLVSVEIPGGVTFPETDINIFLRDEKLERIVGPYASEDGRYLVVDGTLIGYASADLVDIDIPDGVTTIGKGVFQYGRIFTDGGHFGTVTIPESVTLIDWQAFWNVTVDRIELKSTVPPSVGDNFMHYEPEIIVPSGHLEDYRIAEGWTSHADQITSEGCRVYYTTTDGQVINPSRVYELVSNTYENGQGVMVFKDELFDLGNQYGWELTGETTLETLTLPSTVRDICGSVTSRCDNLRQIISPRASSDGRGFIGWGYSLQSFAPAGLSSYVVPEGVKGLGLDAFNCCYDLKQILIPEGVTSISDAAFYHCSSLQTLTFPASLEEIGENVFSECSSLYAYYGKFAGPDNRSVIVDGRLLGIAQAGIESYVIPDGVTSIGSGAIQVYDSWKELTVPASVTSIAYGAFRYSSFEKIVMLGSTPPAVEVSLEENLAEEIIVPSASVEAYKAADGWKVLADKIKGDIPAGGSEGSGIAPL